MQRRGWPKTLREWQLLAQITALLLALRLVLVRIQLPLYSVVGLLRLRRRMPQSTICFEKPCYILTLFCGG